MQPTPTRLDTLILDEAAEQGWGCPCDIVVLDDPHGALTVAALDAVAEHRHGDDGKSTHQPKVLLGARDHGQAKAALALAEARWQRDALTVAGVDAPLELAAFLAACVEEGASYHLVLTHLPKGLAELEYLANTVARHATSATLLAGGNTKHMTRSQNDVLARSFGKVRATRGAGKYRGLVAEGPRPGLEATAVAVTGTQWGDVHGVGGVFGGAELDRGGQFMARAALADLAEGAPLSQILDLGCGNGSVALALLHEMPGVQVTATDTASDAITSATATLAPYGERAQVVWDDAAASLPSRSMEAVLLNPPFHEGTRIDATLVQPLLDAAARVLRPGGVLYFVHNSHLRYRPLLDARFTRVTQIDRDRMFTVLRAHT